MGDMLKGKVAVITGGGGGLGREFCLLMAQQGAKVVVNDFGTNKEGEGRDTSAADTVVADIKSAGGEAVANYDTVATPEGGQNIIKTTVDTFG